MPDAVAAAVARKVALDKARAALRSGARSELEAALAGLPDDGLKATALRREVEAALARTCSTEPPVIQSTQSAYCTSDGVRYEFRIAETGDIAFFLVERVGGVIRVTINSAHSFGKALLEQGDWQHPTVLALLAAWAHHELEQTSDKRQQEVRYSRIDWGRVMHRILSADGWLGRG